MHNLKNLCHHWSQWDHLRGRSRAVQLPKCSLFFQKDWLPKEHWRKPIVYL